MSAENISMTRISDLPVDMGHMYNDSFSNNGKKMLSETESNVYMPLNPHPNPYGNQPAGALPPPPQQQYPYQNQVEVPMQNMYQQQGLQQGLQQGMQQGMQQQQYQEQMLPQSQPNLQPEYRLPQRDIPMDITDFTHDEQIQPNYIPKPKLTVDYVEKHEQATQSKIREYQEQQNKEKQINQWIDKLHTPIILGFLYFIFQLPIINTLVFKRFSFLSIYKDDGNFNLSGLILKSSLFATTFFFIENIMQYIIHFFE